MVAFRQHKPAPCLSVLGTASDVGKSVVVTALCRIANDLGISVAPFKAQNMSNNSFVTRDGGEIGRAQVAQAEAARIAPHVDMNPVLLKPNSDIGAQVVLHGHALKDSSAAAYGALTTVLKQHVVSSLDRLRDAFDLVIMEGAGSCAEINLKSRDIVNFEMARIADAPVLLVADIDRGGVFAQIVGTTEIINAQERNRIKGIIINRFRGDASLFQEGVAYLESRTGIPVLGVIPYLHHIGIDSEDAVVLDTHASAPKHVPDRDRVNIAVIRLPHISNFTDFSPLETDDAVALTYLHDERSLVGYDLVLLPGTKNVRGDLTWLRAVGFENRLHEYVAEGGRLCGICGGYQMLGKSVDDPTGIEGPPGATQGLDFLEMTTTLQEKKVLTHSEGTWLPNGEHVAGYEIHQGRTERAPSLAPVVRMTKHNGECCVMNEGAISEDGRIVGTYLHGLFDLPSFRRSFLVDLRPDLAGRLLASGKQTASENRDRHYDRLADHFRFHLDMAAISALFEGRVP